MPRTVTGAGSDGRSAGAIDAVMGKTVLSTSLRRQVRFGYLFRSMQGTLCFCIAVEGNYLWAVECRDDGSGGHTWSGGMFCALWWAVKHPEPGSVPNPESLQEALAEVIQQKLHAITRVPGRAVDRMEVTGIARE